MGGLVAGEFAAAEPERVLSLALIAPAGLGTEIDAGYIDGFVEASSRKQLKPVLQKLFADPELVTRSMVDDVLKYKRLDGVQAALSELRDQLFAGRRAGPRARPLARTRAPCSCSGARPTRSSRPSHIENAPPGRRSRSCPDVGHSPHMEAAGEVNRLLEGFLSGVADIRGRHHAGTQDDVVEQLRARGDHDGAERADRELGEKVDTDSDAGLLAVLHIDASKLADGFDDQHRRSAMSVALVTGGARGIGRGIAVRLASDGHDVAVADLPSMRAETDAAAAEVGGLALDVDVSDAGQVDAMIAACVAHFGRLDVMVANAGIAQVAPLLEVSPEQFDKLMAVNLRGVFLCYTAAARQMIAQGEAGRSSARRRSPRTRGSGCSGTTRPRSSPCAGSPRPPPRSGPSTASRSTPTARGSSAPRCGS